MKNYATESGETLQQAQPQLLASILLKNQVNIRRDATIQFLSYSLNEENLLDTLMESKYFVMIGKKVLQITHMIVYDTLSRCTEQGVQNHIPNRHDSQ